MRRLIVVLALVAIAALVSSPSRAAEPIKVLAENPRYFEFRGKPTVLITSGAHYGDVLNLDFDYLAYLDELKRHGLNNTRTFAGTYREAPGSFKIKENVLAPAPGRFLSPWAQVQKPNEPEKFDLDRFDEAYFARLKDFLTLAGERGVVVEYNLFCVLYDDVLWAINPMNARNNINGVGDCPRGEVLTLQHDDLTARQLAFVRKAVTELNGFDNLYYEICNEPYFGASDEWQSRIAREIVETEKALPNTHLISWNFANGKGKVEHPDPNVSFYNFHYAEPEVVAMNAHLNRPIGDNETGFKGNADRVYRTQAWEFLLAGGALYNNLDYSFTTSRPDGSAKVEEPTPGGGGPELRKQLAVLAGALQDAEFWKSTPDPRAIEGSKLAEGARAGALARPDGYLIYVDRGPRAEIALRLPPGSFQYHWIDPRSGAVLSGGELSASNEASVKLGSPAFEEDVALSLRAK